MFAISLLVFVDTKPSHLFAPMPTDHRSGEPEFTEGDRVKVTDDCPDEWLRGVTGFVVCEPLGPGDDPFENTYLIEFDSPVRYPDANDCTGGEVDAGYLRRL